MPDPSSRTLENMFAVDLLSVMWIVVAIAVITALARYFYRGLTAEDHPVRSRRVAIPSLKPAQKMLWGACAVWWLMDAAWHFRPPVVIPPFWLPEIQEAVHRAPNTLHGLLMWSTSLWAANPIVWDFSILLFDLGWGLALLMTWKSHPRWLMGLILVWALLRWTLTGWGASAISSTGSLGIGAYVWAAAANYLVLKPYRYRIASTLLFAGTALGDWVQAPQPLHGTAIGIAAGLLGLAWGTWRNWDPLPYLFLAALVTANLVSASGGHPFTHLGMNTFVAPWIMLIAVGHWLNTRTPMALKPLGG